ncbi:uncharacterized protein [Lolium perenne]|uniref:uncharacterized protein n=1 Tax=Lolium perenne TaxID=4522 RepID=UPI0021F558B7|nr:uncharacterized protein LOC127340373 [Lolium perenne]
MTTSLPEELHLEILKRLLPSPQVLARASAVCKEWHRVVNDPVFLHELYRARGGAPVTLGFFHNFDDLHRRFVHVEAAGPAKFAFDSIDHKKRKWQFFDCRHGRVLLHDNWDTLLVWQPMTGDHHLVSYEGPFSLGGRHTGVALTCECAADDGGDDRGTPCNSSHFRLAVVSNHMRTDCLRASVFSSITGKWTSSPVLPLANQIRPEPCVIVGRTLYQPLLDYLVLEFDTDNRTLTTFERPNFGHVRLFKAHGGVLGLAGVLGFTLRVWVRDADAWVMRKTVDLSRILPSLSTPSQNTDYWFTLMPPVKIIGVADGGHDLFLLTAIGIFLFCVNSMELKMVHEASPNMKTVYPYGAFYVPPTTRTPT